jgi:hypothetical protein
VEGTSRDTVEGTDLEDVQESLRKTMEHLRLAVLRAERVAMCTSEENTWKFLCNKTK